MGAGISASNSHRSKPHCLTRYLDGSGVWAHRVSTRKVAIAFEALNYLYHIVVNLNLSYNLIIRKLLSMFEGEKKRLGYLSQCSAESLPPADVIELRSRMPGHHSTPNYSTSLIFDFLILRQDISKFPWLALKSLCSQGGYLQSSCLRLLRLLSSDPTSTVNFMIWKYRSSISDKKPHLNWDEI